MQVDHRNEDYGSHIGEYLSKHHLQLLLRSVLCVVGYKILLLSPLAVASDQIARNCSEGYSNE